MVWKWSNGYWVPQFLPTQLLLATYNNYPLNVSCEVSSFSGINMIDHRWQIQMNQCFLSFIRTKSFQFLGLHCISELAFLAFILFGFPDLGFKAMFLKKLVRLFGLGYFTNHVILSEKTHTRLAIMPPPPWLWH